MCGEIAEAPHLLDLCKRLATCVIPTWQCLNGLRNIGSRKLAHVAHSRLMQKLRMITHLEDSAEVEIDVTEKHNYAAHEDVIFII
jgi:hypothetical protein